jgi:5-methylcytosine-specific restriction endonuclease McrA
VNSAGKEELRNQLYEKYGRKCYYCGIEEERFYEVWGRFYGGRKRGARLEIDRKNNDYTYHLDNCVLACAICNNAKSDKFTYEEFKRVGEVIKVIWRDRNMSRQAQ